MIVCTAYLIFHDLIMHVKIDQLRILTDVYKPRPNRIPNEYRSYEEIPEIMTVFDVADVLRISVASAYTVTAAEGFPVMLLNSQRRIRKDLFIEWLKSKENGYGKNEEER